MRPLVALLLILGLAPGLGEVAEAVVHFAAEGHLAHSEADRGDLGDQGEEHGCGTTQHRCSCCASQVLAAAPPGPAALGTSPTLHRAAPRPSPLASIHEPAPPFRPPISAS